MLRPFFGRSRPVLAERQPLRPSSRSLLEMMTRVTESMSSAGVGAPCSSRIDRRNCQASTLRQRAVVSTMNSCLASESGSRRRPPKVCTACRSDAPPGQRACASATRPVGRLADRLAELHGDGLLCLVDDERAATRQQPTSDARAVPAGTRAGLFCPMLSGSRTPTRTRLP